MLVRPPVGSQVVLTMKKGRQVGATVIGWCRDRKNVRVRPEGKKCYRAVPISSLAGDETAAPVERIVARALFTSVMGKHVRYLVLSADDEEDHGCWTEEAAAMMVRKALKQAGYIK